MHVFLEDQQIISSLDILYKSSMIQDHPHAEIVEIKYKNDQIINLKTN